MIDPIYWQSVPIESMIYLIGYFLTKNTSYSFENNYLMINIRGFRISLFLFSISRINFRNWQPWTWSHPGWQRWRRRTIRRRFDSSGSSRPRLAFNSSTTKDQFSLQSWQRCQLCDKNQLWSWGWNSRFFGNQSKWSFCQIHSVA